MKKFAIVLESGEDNEIDRAEMETEDDDDAIDDAITEKLNEWRLSVGDIIRIVETEEQPAAKSLKAADQPLTADEVEDALRTMEAEGLVARR